MIRQMKDIASSFGRAVLIAALIFQGVIGSAYAAFAASAPEGATVPVICSAYGIEPGSPDAPDGPPETRACPLAASVHQAAGAGLPQLALLAAPAVTRTSFATPARDQWPEDTKPAFANSRAPPRPV